MQVTSSIHKIVGFPRKPLAAVISAACLQLVCAPAIAASCPAAVSGTITASGSYDATCVVGAGEQLQVTNLGSISVVNSGNNAVLVDTGISANLINNAGSIASPYAGGMPPYLDAIHLNAGATLTNGIVNSGSISAYSNAIALDNATLHGGVLNTASGTIESQYYSGISLVSGAQLYDGIDNAGIVSGARGININNSTLNGGIHNRLSGQINDMLGIGYGILVEGAGHLNGDIFNEGSIDGGEGAITFTGSSVMAGNITNTGTIYGGYANLGQQAAILFDSSSMTGNIDNQQTGLIDGAENAGIMLVNGSALTGSILNAGTITAAGGNSSATVNIDNSSISGALNNSGTISNTGTGFGVLLANNSHLGSLVNSGSITASDNGVNVTGSTIAQGINNSGTISGQQGIVLQNGAAITAGGIVNTGHITGDSIGIIAYNSTLTGGITNSSTGTITGNSQGISITDTTFNGNIDNSGLIDGLVAIWVRESTFNGDIINRASGSITDSISGYAILIGSGATISNITNSGIVSGTNGIGIVDANVTGAITNNSGGTITADAGDGIQVIAYGSTPSTVGSIVNSGTITGANGIHIENATIAGAIANNAGGVITATANGIQLGSTSTPTTVGSVTNGGTIDGAKGIVIYSGASVTQGITNSGIINGSTGGIEITLGAALAGGINNSGTIAGGSGTGILIQDASFSGNIINSSTGTISGRTAAIDISNASGSTAIDNSGTISGVVLLGSHTLNLNGNDSHVIGTVEGGNVNVNGSFTPQGNFSVDTFTIASTGTLLSARAITASGGMTNLGTLSVKAAEPFAVTGNYTQSADGVFLMGAKSPTEYGTMTVSGSATLAPLTHISVDVTQGATLIANGVLPGVITAGSLDASTFTVTDNSVLFNFTGVVNGNAVDLNVRPGLRVYDTVIQNNNFPGAGAAQVFDSLIQSGTATGDMATVISALGTLTTSKEVSDAVQQTLPVLTGGTTTAVLGALDATGKIVQARQEANLGLSSGEGFLTDNAFWLKPFGSWSSQSNRNGVAGYDANGGGMVAGIDGVLSDVSRLGFAVAYARTSLDSDSDIAPQSADIDTYQVVMYGSQTLAERTDLNYQVDFGENKTDADRDINFGGLQRRASADYSGWSAHFGAGIGHLYTLNAATSVTPSVRIDYAALKNRSYTESGAGALDLDVAGQTTDQLVIGVDAKLNYEIQPDLSFTANLGGGYDTYNRSNSVTSTFVGGGPAFITRGLDPSPWIEHGGIGLVYKQENGMEFSGRYDIEARPSDFHAQTVSVKFRMPF